MKKPSTPLLLLLAMLVSFTVTALPKLNSYPSARATIYLDFDGHAVHNAFWNGGVPFTCAPAGITDAQITEVFNRVAEDYRPFDINITTVEATFIAAPLSKRIRVVITPTSSWFTGVGGVSFIGSFKWGDDTPAFVFSDRLGPKNAKLIAECCAHESGHAVGLSHQSSYDGSCHLTSTYNEGIGTGEAGWAPIMGNSYYRNMSGWNNGPTPYGCANKQDNLSIITNTNGFGYRVDDYSDDINNNPTMITLAGPSLDGVIATNTDEDAFSFTLLQNSIVRLNIKPFSVDAGLQGANLDVKMSLYNANKMLVQTFNPAATMSVTMDTLLNAGTYYVVVDGAGNSNVDDYGSLGAYTITSSVGSVLPIRQVILTGRTIQNKHELGWSIDTDEPIKQVQIESSANGIHFNTINTVTGLQQMFSYHPVQQPILYYRIKAISVAHQAVYSNTIQLKQVAQAGKLYRVSTLASHQITVAANDAYQFVLNDANGNRLRSGKGLAGNNVIDIHQLPAGMYVLQLFNHQTSQTERIIKAVR